MSLMLIGAVIAVIAGLAVKFGVDAYNRGAHSPNDHLKPYGARVKRLPSVTWPEFALGAVICCALIVPAVVWAGDKLAVNNIVTYHENWGGFEQNITFDVTTCHRDGSCRHEYDCDPYTVTRTRTVSDGDGGTRTETYTETEWHQCPYATEEVSYYVDTTLGRFTIADHIFGPNSKPWRWGRRLPGRVEVGPPAAWTAAQSRLNSGRPGPVVERHDYDNYILASESQTLKRFSSSIDRYREAGLLPDFHTKVTGHYGLDKLYPVAVTLPGGAAVWHDAANRLSAALGAELQGDLHVVIVDSAKVPDGADYLNALVADWQSPRYGKDALAKNTVVLAIGTDGQAVTWARATTGMPEGNNELLGQLANELPGVILDAETLLGSPASSVGSADVAIRHTDGAVERILWGVNAFERVSMSCTDEGEDCIGYQSLKELIEPTGGQKALILFFAALASLAVWGAFLIVDDRLSHRVTGWLRRP